MTYRRRLPSPAAWAAVLSASLLASGCIVVPARPYRPAYVIEAPVQVAPPPPQEEVVGVAPQPGYLWVGGYWGWNGGRHEWRPGHWEAGRPHERWVPHRWVRANDGWRLHQGHWEGR